MSIDATDAYDPYIQPQYILQKPTKIGHENKGLQKDSSVSKMSLFCPGLVELHLQ